MIKIINLKTAMINKGIISVLFFCAFLFTLLSASYAQSTKISISGTISDAQGEGIIGASIKVKGTTTAATADAKGNYKITVPNNKSVIVFSSVGFVAKEETVGAKKIINVTLNDDSKLLSEIVVVGYGEVNRKDLTGSVSSVNINDLNKAPVKSFDDALAGRIAGVQVTSPDGQPGASPSITIRGANSVTQNNSPLYVIDGFPIENYDNNAINPADIESIDVLKDASSSAIYGSRGANGVIIITTKKGLVSSPKVNYRNYFGFQSNTGKVALMNGYEYIKYQLEVDSVYTAGLGATAYQIYDIKGPGNPNGAKTLADFLNAPSIDWQDQIFRTAGQQNHDLSIRGGNKDTKYSFSGNYLNQDGTLIVSTFKRYQTRFTLDQNLNKQFKFGINANYSNTGTTGSQISGQRSTSDAFLISAWRYRPISSVSNEELLSSMQDPSLVDISSINYQWNPVFTRNNEIRNRNTSQITANAYLDYSILKDLKFKVTGSINSRALKYEVFNTSMSRLGSPLSTLGNGGPNGSVTNTNNNDFLNENTLTYNKIFHKVHKLNIVSGATFSVSRLNANGAGATNLPNEALGVAGLGQGTPQSISSLSSENTLASFLGRANYSYKSKYLATATFRADGSSKFVGNNKWGYFPSGSLAYRISEENFLKNNKIISEAKIRISYGVIGNNRVSDYASYALLGTGGNDSYTSGNTFSPGTYPLTLSNPNLKWETTRETDLGLDLGLFKQRLSIVADYYNKETVDLLLSSQLPGSSGYTTAFQNIGSVQNRGFEFGITSVNFDKKNFKWSTSFNISFNKNKILALTSGQNQLLTTASWSSSNTIANSPGYIAKIGQPIGMFYGLVSDGVYQYSDFDQNTPGVYTLKADVASTAIDRTKVQPGFWKFKDQTNDKLIDVNDLTVIGNPNPDFIGGLSNNFSFKQFDLNVFLQYSYGNDVLNVNRILMEGGGGTGGTKGANMFATYENRWTPTNPSNEYAASGLGGSTPTFYPSRIVEDGSFIRLKTVNVGYNFSNNIIKKIKINNLRLYASAQNLYTLTKYSGLDPEVDGFRSALTPGLDYSSYPRAKTITFGLDITL